MTDPRLRLPHPASRRHLLAGPALVGGPGGVFGEPGDWYATDKADVSWEKAVCWTCPVRRACLAFALDTGEAFGIWRLSPTTIERAVVRAAQGRHRGRPVPGRLTMVEPVTGPGWSPTVQAQVAARLARPDLGRWLGQVSRVRHCARPSGSPAPATPSTRPPARSSPPTPRRPSRTASPMCAAGTGGRRSARPARMSTRATCGMC